MKCDDCIHFEVCGLRDQMGEYAEQCEQYKDTHLFRKLPCRPDDSIFIIVPDRSGKLMVDEFTVHAVIIKRDRTILETGIGRFTWGKEPCWLSHEEAEQALKEREEHDPN